MSRNIFQVYTDNPATDFEGTDIFYLGRSPYGVTNDMGVLYSTLAAQFTPSAPFFYINTPTNVIMQPNFGYKTTADAITLTLPMVCPENSIIQVVGWGGNWQINQQIGQQIICGDVSTTLGVSGFVESTKQYQSITLLCTIANLSFLMISCTDNPDFN